MRFALPLFLSLSLGLPATSQDLAGPYLAGRQAALSGDHAQAAEYYEQALRMDRSNPDLISNAVLAYASLGNWDAALAVAGRVPGDAEGRELLNIIEQVGRIRAGDHSGSLAAIDAGRGAGPFVDELSAAWMMLGEGRMSDASAMLQDMASSEGPIPEIARRHLALMRAAVGDFERAQEILSGAAYGPVPFHPRSLQAQAQILVQLDRSDDALALLEETLALVSDPSIEALRDAIAADTARAYDFVVSPEDGAAEVFYTVAQALGADQGGALSLLYARAAHTLRPGHTDAVLLAAELLESTGQLQLAADTYAQVPDGDPLFVAAETGRANALFDLGAEEAAVAALEALTVRHGDMATTHATLGDALRRMERFDGAITAYTNALDRVDTTQTRYWYLYYTRAIALEREGRWDEAEADFRYALELNPGQPNVLNYLGYSLVEQRRNFDEALAMIEQAVETRPESGYIVDSLAWVLYRLGRFGEAVAPMERAVELVPTDPVINDHLGDVYWVVGRTREARFQWQRALSFDPLEEDAARIRLKLEIGLDEVLEQEGGVGLVEE